MGLASTNSTRIWSQDACWAQCFSNISVCQNLLESLLNHRLWGSVRVSDTLDLEWGPGMCTSNKFPDDAPVAVGYQALRISGVSHVLSHYKVIVEGLALRRAWGNDTRYVDALKEATAGAWGGGWCGRWAEFPNFLSCAALFAITQGKLLTSTTMTQLRGVFPGRNGRRLIELHDSHRSLSPSLSKYSTSFQLKMKSHLRLISWFSQLRLFLDSVLHRLEIINL